MILVDHEIRALCEQGMVTPFEPALLNPASLDLRLGMRLLIEVPESTSLRAFNLNSHSQETPYLMAPGEFLLAETVETFNLPTDIAAQFVLKSSRAREGLEHLLAGYCDPGWNGSKLTLELHNSRRFHPLPIWPGMKIGQMVFYRLSAEPERDYSKTGRYCGDLSVTASKG